MSTFHARLLIVAALLYGILHLRYLPSTLEDLDSVNFALGAESFDVAAHRPHPPGYPLYIGAARLSDSAIRAWFPEWSRDRRAAVGLAWWSVVAAVVSLWAITRLWMAVGLSPTQATWAALLAVASPLFWVTAARPLSDLPGLAAALVVQLGFVEGLRTLRADQNAAVPRVWWWAAAGAGLAIGVRSQTLWLTMPLLAWCAGELLMRRRWRAVCGLAAAALVGVAVWLVPLLVISGGPTSFLAALGTQGAEDFLGVEMLATRPSWRLLGEALHRTFVASWLHSWLADVVLLVAAIGVVRLVRHGQRILAMLLLGFWPYLVFHLTFQETATLRYALPVMVPVSALVVIALAALPRRVAWTAFSVLLVTVMAVSHPVLMAYGRLGAPVFRAWADVSQGATNMPPHVIGMHRRIWSESRQALVWVADALPYRLLPTPRAGEVQAVVRHFLTGATGPVWFFANPARRDLSLIDRRARRLVAMHRWPPSVAALLAMARPTDLDTWLIESPRWMVGPGWALTPEIGGVTAALGLGPHRAPSRAYLRRGAEPLTVVIGARHIGNTGDGPVTLVVGLEGRVLARWTVEPGAPAVKQWIALSEGVPSGDGTFAALTVAAEGVEATPVPPVSLQFFDAATGADVLLVYDRGWHEPEQQPGTAVVWRWMSSSADLQFRAPAGAVTLHLEGEVPPVFSRPTTLVVRAGGREVRRVTVQGAFQVDVPLSADMAALAGGVITLEADQSFSPIARGESLDARELSLRLFVTRLERAAR